MRCFRATRQIRLTQKKAVIDCGTVGYYVKGVSHFPTVL